MDDLDLNTRIDQLIEGANIASYCGSQDIANQLLDEAFALLDQQAAVYRMQEIINMQNAMRTAQH